MSKIEIKRRTDPMSYREIGKVLGISYERVRQIEVEALKKVRRRLLAKHKVEDLLSEGRDVRFKPSARAAPAFLGVDNGRG